ncbi:arginine decarboxylase [Clostridia bacterium]|nr:arginine decarboxylase [Clostridia bacterium]
MDLSEVRWTDDYHGASSSILEAETLAADAWGAARTRFLVNGTSSGIIASICGTCGEGEEIIIPRNAHKSAVYGLVLSGAVPVYVQPEVVGTQRIRDGLLPGGFGGGQFSKEPVESVSDRLPEGLIGGLSPEALAAALGAHPAAKAVFAVSPTYHGVISDLARLAELAHAHGLPLIADEAHGNHDYFSDRLPQGALDLGCDLVCQSTHKMSGSLTQSSMLHIGHGAETSGRVDFERVNRGLSLTQTTSPSYLLLASLDVARSYIATEGERILNGVLDALGEVRAEISGAPAILGPNGNTGVFGIADSSGSFGIPGICVLGSELVGSYDIYAYEPLRLVITAKGLGLSGYELFRILREEYGVEAEFGDPVYCVCLAGLGTTRAHGNKLAAALREISARFVHTDSVAQNKTSPCVLPSQDRRPVPLSCALPALPPMVTTPREAWFAPKERVPFAEAVGRVSGELVVPYPPGIPVLCPGERITPEVHDFLRWRQAENCHLHCSAGDTLETILIVR